MRSKKKIGAAIKLLSLVMMPHFAFSASTVAVMSTPFDIGALAIFVAGIFLAGKKIYQKSEA